MKLAGKPGYGRERVGVLDAGVAITRFDPTRRGHPEATRLLGRSRPAALRLIMSTVNLAETLHHARHLTEASGVDPVAILQSFGVEVDAPDVAIARRAARIAAVHDLSLADRFALATALERGGRLFTTDPVLASAARSARVPVTKF